MAGAVLGTHHTNGEGSGGGRGDGSGSGDTEQEHAQSGGKDDGVAQVTHWMAHFGMTLNGFDDVGIVGYDAASRHI